MVEEPLCNLVGKALLFGSKGPKRTCVLIATGDSFYSIVFRLLLEVIPVVEWLTLAIFFQV